MLVQELYTVRPDGVALIKTYSDQSVYIRKIETGEIYDAAIDPLSTLIERHYEETDIPIEEENFEEQVA